MIPPSNPLTLCERDLISTLCSIATFGSEHDSKVAAAAVRRIDPRAHWCYEWDGLFITSADVEFQSCACDHEEIVAD